MKMYGKILLFKPTSGNGIIINTSREKITFTIEDWDDFDVMPTLGLEVCFHQEEKQALNIVAKENESDLRDSKVESPIEESQEITQSFEETVTEEISVTEKVVVKEEIPVPEEIVSEREQEEENTVDLEVQNDKDAFEREPLIEVIEEMTEELEKPRPESITNSLNISAAVSNYFTIIKQNIDRRKNYKKADGRLDYRLIRRFIWTTYNNLTEIDLKIITPKVKVLCDDLKDMEKIYDDFVRKTKNPSVAYEEVFLSCQAEYQKIRNGAETIIEKLMQLKTNEKIIGGAKEVKKKEIEDEIHTEQFDLLKDELKSLNGAYVDVVHMMAELDERYKKDMQLLQEFEAEYREDFYKVFSQKAKAHEFDLVDILNAQAFVFDMQQWHQAKRSKIVREYFKTSSITGELNTKTYLKYYLSSQDEEKATGETKKLYELYEYLVSVQKDYIMVVSADYRDAIDYETAIHHIDKKYSVKSFVDELLAIKWAMKNSVKILVLESTLTNMQVEKFLFNYNKNVISIPKIILLGDKPRSNIMNISKLLNSGVSPQLVASSVTALIDD